MGIQLVLHNIRSVYNVGAILRTAEGLGVENVVFSGYTPRYHDPKALPHLREKLDHQIAKSALGAEKLVPQVLVDDLPAWLTEQKSQGAVIAGLENNLSAEEEKRKIVLGDWGRDYSSQGTSATNGERIERARPVTTGESEVFPEESRLYPSSSEQDLVLILGEEVQGIPPEIRALCDYFLEIPMVGQKESFNVSVATAIAVWELIGNKRKLGEL